VAIPFESVVSVSVIDWFANVPLALEDGGAVNVTVTPLIGLPFCVTTADRGVGNGVPTRTLCNDPFVAFTATTGAGSFVTLKPLDAETPWTETPTT